MKIRFCFKCVDGSIYKNDSGEWEKEGSPVERIETILRSNKYIIVNSNNRGDFILNTKHIISGWVEVTKDKSPWCKFSEEVWKEGGYE